jgi:AraC family transcriptional regulator
MQRWRLKLWLARSKSIFLGQNCLQSRSRFKIVKTQIVAIVPDLEPEHLHLVSSFDYGWRGVNLLLEQEPRGEMPEAEMAAHFVTIALGNFRGSYKVGGGWRSVDYAKGDIIILPQQELFPHVEIDRQVPLLELFIEPKTITAIAPGYSLTPQINIRDPLIEQMGLALYRAAKTSGADSALYAESMAIGLSAHLMRNYSSANLVTPPGTLAPKKLQQIYDYIAANLDRSLSLAELSHVLDLSLHHFATLFKRSTGLTPHQYVLKARIDRAITLLKTTELPIVAIAHRVGFQTQSHFTRIFRQQTRMTPKQLRDSV